MVKYRLRKAKQGILDFFRPSVEVSFTCRETFLSRLGIGRAYKTKISSDKKLADDRETSRIAEILSDDSGKRINGSYPLQLPIERLHELQDYEVKLFGRWIPINSRTIDFLEAVYDYANSHPDDGSEEGLIKYLERRFG